MRLVELTCPKCGAKLETNAELQTVTCNYCGNQFALDSEIIHVQHDITEQSGYEFEKGRLRAREEAIQQEQARIQKAKEDAIRRDQENAALFQKALKKQNLKSAGAFMLGLFLAIVAFFIMALATDGGGVPLVIVGSLFIAGAIWCAVYIRWKNNLYGLKRKADQIAIWVVVVLAICIALPSCTTDENDIKDSTSSNMVEESTEASTESVEAEPINDTLILEDGITEIPKDAFNGARGIRKVYIPDTVEQVYDVDLAYLQTDLKDGEKVDIYYGGSEDRWNEIFTVYPLEGDYEIDFTGNHDDDYYEGKGAELAQRFNRFLGGGYDETKFVFHYAADPKDLD